MAMFCEKAFQKEFEHKVSKQAYLSACRWLAVNIYNNAELAKNLLVAIDKKEQSELPTFVVTVYVRINEKEQREAHCKKCKMLHTIFYSVNGVNCNECRARAYYKRLDENISGIVGFYKEMFEDKEADE